MEQFETLLSEFDIPAFADGYTLLLLVALVFNLFVCREAILNRTFKSPQALVARFVQFLEMRYNRPELTPAMRRADGISSTTVFIIAAGIAGYIFDWAAHIIPYLWLLEALAIGTFFNIRTHFDQARVMARGLDRSTEEGRATVALISGRDTENLDEAGLARVAVETTVRTFSSGIVAPAVYFWLFGGLGLFIFKIVNIASDMIDECDQVSTEYGWAVSRINQLMMWPCDRLAALYLPFGILFVRGGSFWRSLTTPFAAASQYFQKSVGYSMAAMAGGLKIKLGGPVCFEGATVENKWVGEGSPIVDTTHIRQGRRIFILCAIFFISDIIALYYFKIPAVADFIPFVRF